ncbi:MAG: amidohydrolase family protein [Actinomycetaceae bacterium]|nr:amidohydrolase family protein [Actinomycetaceae bacterium]MDY6082241.1 amidohydrolase family protein [Actinomycetaceae bacterium]
MARSRAQEIQEELLPHGYRLSIIDAHHHFWDLKKPGHWPWLQEAYDPNFFLGDYHAMIREFMPKQYRDETAGWDIAATVHCQAERAREDQVLEDEFCEKLNAETDGRFPAAAIGHVDFLQDDVDQILAEHKKHEIVKGIRSKPKIAKTPDEPYGGKGTLDDPDWVAGLGKLEELDFEYDLRVPYYHLSQFAEILHDYPRLRVTVNHCGLPLDRSDAGLKIWRSGMKDLARLDNVSVKISELGVYPNRWLTESNIQVVHDTFSIFGPERSMFATNMPVAVLTASTFDDVMETVLRGLGALTAEELDRVFYLNAAQTYGIDVARLKLAQ